VIAYFDTSAIIPLIVEEPGSAVCERLWEEADRVVSVRLLYAEARAALAQAHRLGRLDSAQLRAAVTELEYLADDLDHVEVDEDLVQAAGQIAEDRAMRGYDAVHLAAALRLAADDLVLVTGDRDLARAASEVGLTVALTSS
jgi:uncharacterized protein